MLADLERGLAIARDGHEVVPAWRVLAPDGDFLKGEIIIAALPSIGEASRLLLMQTGWRTANVGSRLKPPITQEGTARTASLPAVLGKTRRTE
jgi:hypothetical protein